MPHSIPREVDADIAGTLREGIRSGVFDAYAELLADDAVVDGNLAGPRRIGSGPQAAEELLAGVFGGPGELVEWRAGVHEAGIDLWLERVGEDGVALRQRHYLHVQGGKVVRHWLFCTPPRTTAPEIDAGNPFTCLGEIAAREPLVSTGWSGNRIERVRMADGRVLIAKRIVPGADFIGRCTADPGREALLHVEGIHKRMPPTLDPAVVAAEHDGEAWWVVMRDVHEHLLESEGAFSRDDARRMLAAVNSMWEEFWDERVAPAGTLVDRLRLTGPAVAEAELDRLDLLPKQFPVAWEAFEEAVEDDVAAPILSLLRDPSPLVRELDACGVTLLHGDFRDENIALEDDRVVLLDWGIATQGHPVVDFAWFLVHDAWRIEATHDEIVEDFRRVRGDADDPRALELGMISGLVQYGWIFGLAAVVHPDPVEREWARWELGWWVPRVRSALETWHP